MRFVYCDEDLVAVDKPSGLAVHRGWTNDRDTALTRVRDALLQHVDPVHRLDRATSGVLIFARTKPAAAELGRAFAEGGVAKRYLAWVRGCAPEVVFVDHPIVGDDGRSREARTAFRRLALLDLPPIEGVRARAVSLVEATPETGRLHQIRRHLKHLGHPVAGDVRYGKGAFNRALRDLCGLDRMALHCASLSFPHPRTGAQLRLEAPCPEAFVRLACVLGRGAAIGP